MLAPAPHSSSSSSESNAEGRSSHVKPARPCFFIAPVAAPSSLGDAILIELDSCDSLLNRLTGCFWNVNLSATTSLDSDDGEGDRDVF